MLGSSRISAVKFGHSTPESVLNASHAAITSPDLYRGNVPYPGGVYDAHMGTTGHGYNCLTCGGTKCTCLGHPGHIKTNQPIYSPTIFTDVRKWLKVICFNCGKCIINPSNVKASKAKILEEAAKAIGTNIKKCIHCNTPHPIIKKSPVEPLGIIAVNSDDGTKTDLLAHMAMKYFGRVSQETVQSLGRSAGPLSGVITYIQVPPNLVRPDTKKMGASGRSANDDLTSMLQHIIKCNDALPTTVPADYKLDYIKLIYNLQNAYNDFIKAKADSSMVSLLKRIKGKGGRNRKNQLGKRVFRIARSTIVGDPTLLINELGVPIDFARKLYIEETVQEYNMQRLIGYCLNGTKKYPGATKIIKKGAEYNVDTFKDIELESGDIVRRNLIDGDQVYFNRQPSLMDSNISCMNARITRDPKNKTLMMNVLSCKLFNADF